MADEAAASAKSNGRRLAKPPLQSATWQRVEKTNRPMMPSGIRTREGGCRRPLVIRGNRTHRADPSAGNLLHGTAWNVANRACLRGLGNRSPQARTPRRVVAEAFEGLRWALQGSNLRPLDYESTALTS